MRPFPREDIPTGFLKLVVTPGINLAGTLVRNFARRAKLPSKFPARFPQFPELQESEKTGGKGLS